jgi:MoxR-like ATPase
MVALATACNGGSDRTITVAGQPVAVAPLVDAHAALCQAAAEPDAARRHFFDRAHEPLHTVARALEDVDRAQAAQLLQAKEKVESELSNPPASLADDLRWLAGVYRDGLGRLAITAPPCDK